jgi:hypothetical protein
MKPVSSEIGGDLARIGLDDAFSDTLSPFIEDADAGRGLRSVKADKVWHGETLRKGRHPSENTLHHSPSRC